MIEVFNMVTGEYTEYNAADPLSALIFAAIEVYDVLPTETELHFGQYSIGFKDLAVKK